MPVTLNVIESTTELGQEIVEIVLASSSTPGPAGPGVPVGGTDGQVLTKTSATDYATAWEDPTGGGGGAPTDATYLVGASNGTLSAEIVVGATPGGELGNTWASPTVDAVHSGSSHAAVQAAAEANAAAALSAHDADTTGIHGIADTSALVTTATFNDHSARHEDGGADEISLTGLSGTSAALQAHLDDTSDAHDASAVSLDSTNLTGTATNVQAGMEELEDAIDGKQPLDSDLTAIAALTTNAAGRGVLTLADPGADRIVFWDDSAGAYTHLTAGDGLTITDTTIEADGGGGGGAELEYTETTTSDTSVTATTSGTAETFITASAVVLDGSTRIAVEFYSPLVLTPGGANNRGILVELWGAKDGGAAAAIAVVANPFGASNVSFGQQVLTCNYLTPASGSWVYSIRVYVSGGTGQVLAGSGGAGAYPAAYLRISEAPGS